MASPFNLNGIDEIDFRLSESTPLSCQKERNGHEFSPPVTPVIKNDQLTPSNRHCSLNYKSNYRKRKLNTSPLVNSKREPESNFRSLIEFDFLSEDDTILGNIDLDSITGKNLPQKLIDKSENLYKLSNSLRSSMIMDGNSLSSWDVSASDEQLIPQDPKSTSDSLTDSVIDIFQNSKENFSCLSNAGKSHWNSSQLSSMSNLTSRMSVCNHIKNQLLENNAKNNVSIYERNPVNTEEESFFGLPAIIQVLIQKYKGISELYSWQKECLSLKAVKERKNLIYALPTSGGKTLVAEILILKEILCQEKNVIFILPYVSIVQEKVRSLSPFGIELNFLVEEYAAGKGAFPPIKRRRKRTVFVATIEKASGLINSLFETNRLADEIGLICIDELHLIGESRGAILESSLVKILFSNLKIQIIGMSATIGNLSEVAQFLNAETYEQNFRPVALSEYVKYDKSVYSVDKKEGKLHFTRKIETQVKDPDYVGGFVKEVIPDGSCLVFCASKKNCENIALLICGVLDGFLKTHKCEEKKALFRALASEGNGFVCPTLSETLQFGVAYHHSGLTTAERKLLEEAFHAGTICCICCTSTLAAGVNLPAKRVILRSPYVGNQFISTSQYKQMIGRGGRAGFGEAGESFLICQPTETEKVMNLLNSSVNSCYSQLLETNTLPSLILSVVGLNIANSQDDIINCIKCSLLYIQAKALDFDVESIFEKLFDDLCEAGALSSKSVDGNTFFELSQLGRAAVKGNISIEDAKKLYADLKVALKCVSLLNYLHRLFLITPYSMVEQIPINRDSFFDAYMKLNAEELHAANVIGITEACFMNYMHGKKFKEEKLIALKRFYLTLILHSLWGGRNVWQVSSSFHTSRGLVHSFLTSASTFNSCVVRFCEEIEEMKCFAILLKDMADRLIYCCSVELLPLMELPAVKLGRAKQLFNAGFKNLQMIANADVNSLVSKIDHLPKRVAGQIIAAAKLLLLSKAELLQEEAEEVLAGLNFKLDLTLKL